MRGASGLRTGWLAEEAGRGCVGLPWRRIGNTDLGRPEGSMKNRNQDP